MTIQASELIFFEGEKHSLINVPAMPDSIIQEKSQEFYVESTACWRGYVGTWEIKDDKLYLVDLSSSNYEFVENPPIFADWINGQLKFGIGKKKFSSDWVSLYVYETEIHLTIEKGLVIKTKNIKNDSYNADPRVELLRRKKSSRAKNKLQSFLE